jgi:hypothetical protein
MTRLLLRRPSTLRRDQGSFVVEQSSTVVLFRYALVPSSSHDPSNV